MKKRLRKKLRLKEFYEYIFHIDGNFIRQLSDDEVDNFVDDLCDFVDEIGVTFVGVTDHNKFHYSFMGLYKYQNRLKEKHIELIETKFSGLTLIGSHVCRVIKTTDVED